MRNNKGNTKELVCKDRGEASGKELRFFGDSTFIKCKIDNELLKDNDNKKCDYWIVNNHGISLFVELKSISSRIAREQIENSYHQCDELIRCYNNGCCEASKHITQTKTSMIHYAAIVFHSTPKPTSLQIDKKKLQKKGFKKVFAGSKKLILYYHTDTHTISEKQPPRSREK